MVETPDDVAKMVERLSAPGTWARHKDNLVASSAAETLVRDDAPFEAAALIQSLSSQLAEARAERDKAREYGKEARVLGAKAEDKRIHEQHMRSIAEARAEAAEAERDRLAADNARLEEARAKQWRLRRDAEGSRDVCKAACDTMRMERDEAWGLLERAQQIVPDTYVNWHETVRNALANVKGG